MEIIESPRRKLRYNRPKSSKKRPKKVKRGKLVQRLDQIFSSFIRQSRADSDGMVKCFTCPKIMHWNQAQNSHYVSRSIRALRWSEANCRIGCYGCNVMHGGNLITYRENLVKEIGEIAVENLEAARHNIFRPTDEWLQEMIQKYEEKLQHREGLTSKN